MTKTKWWFTYELTNGDIKIGEIINDPVEKIRIKTLFSDAKVDLWLRKDEALSIAYGIIKTIFEIERKKIEKLDAETLNKYVNHSQHLYL